MQENPLGFSDAVWLAIIGLITIIAKDVLDQWRQRFTRGEVHKATEQLAVVHDKVDTAVERVEIVQADVLKIEKATNSMKDALVLATGEAKFLEGEKSGKEQEQIKQANVIVEANKGFGP